jgi:hypothetical protein
MLYLQLDGRRREVKKKKSKKRMGVVFPRTRPTLLAVLWVIHIICNERVI